MTYSIASEKICPVVTGAIKSFYFESAALCNVSNIQPKYMLYVCVVLGLQAVMMHSRTLKQYKSNLENKQ